MNMKTIFAISAALLLFTKLQAGNYSIDWHKIAGGGGAGAGAGAGGNYSLAGTIGQHDASAVMRGGNYAIAGGFWVVTQVVQTPGAPTLYISATTNSVTIFWQEAAGFSLQQNLDVGDPAGWSASSGYSLVNGTNVLTLVNPAEKLYFRLIHP
jgi:hypothetical protein